VLLQTSLVGSIGVISATFGAPEAARRLGIERRVYTAGEAKMQLDPFLPVKPDQASRGMTQSLTAELMKALTFA
jgi:ClpP class serine protease